MREDQLKLLETRINNAIIFIETLKSREKKLIREKEELDIKISSFERVLAEKDSKIEELKGSQGFLREKIEAILGKLESFATIDTEGQFDLKAFPENEKSESYVPDEVEDDVIIEDEIVDLKEENVKDEYTVEEKQPVITIEIDPQEENVLQSETSVEESEARENASGNAEEKQESRNDESLVVDTVLEKKENLLFTAEGQNSSESLFQNGSLNKISKIRENTGGNFNKRWIDNNPFVQT